MEAFAAISLSLVVAWPLLLAVPAVHSRLPQPRFLAIAPALVTVLWLRDCSVELPWALFGGGLAIDRDIRWVLAMSMAIWLPAATLAKDPVREPARETTFFILTLAGNLGAILATDLVGFFAFSTLMNYAFYGLLVHRAEEPLRRTGRLFVIAMVAADLALFEALLLAAAASTDLRFEPLIRAIAGASAAPMYTSMVLAGFALRAGIWPAHFWLSAAFKSAPRSTALLLCSGPVAMGLLGAVRWAPLGESAFYLLGTGLQVIGGAALLYSAVRLFRHGPLKMISAWGAVAAGGLFATVLGTGLAEPAIWRQYQHFSHPLIASLGILLATLTLAVARLEKRRRSPPVALPPQRAVAPSAHIRIVRRWALHRLLAIQSYGLGAWGRLGNTPALRWIRQWESLLGEAERQLLRWPVAITLFAFLGIAAALLEFGT